LIIIWDKLHVPDNGVNSSKVILTRKAWQSLAYSLLSAGVSPPSEY